MNVAITSFALTADRRAETGNLSWLKPAGRPGTRIS